MENDLDSQHGLMSSKKSHCIFEDSKLALNIRIRFIDETKNLRSLKCNDLAVSDAFDCLFTYCLTNNLLSAISAL